MLITQIFICSKKANKKKGKRERDQKTKENQKSNQKEAEQKRKSGRIIRKEKSSAEKERQKLSPFCLFTLKIEIKRCLWCLISFAR